MSLLAATFTDKKWQKRTFSGMGVRFYCQTLYSVCAFLCSDAKFWHHSTKIIL